MAQKIMGIDLGTNSIGLALRDPDKSTDISDQLVYFTSIVFPKGVGNGQSGEFSYAAERRRFRSTRRLYQARKYRIWATLELLINHQCCPLTIDDLDRWRKYDKTKGLKRQYPIDAIPFEQWVRLDFNGDGIPDYRSPYQLREELTLKPIDWDSQIDRYKFGRAMYHIAQRRGFKSSKGETLKDSKESEDLSNIEISASMKKSEEKKSKSLKDYMESHNLKTVGCAFAQLEREGIRVRNSIYQAVQSQYLDEVREICLFQHIDTIDHSLFTGLTSTKAKEGTIFYRRPLRSQKGAVGKCVLEPFIRRCPTSHPDYEEFRALSFINNIKFRCNDQEEWKSLSPSERANLYNDCFTRTKPTFRFEEIRKWLEKSYPGNQFSYDNHTINYRDYTTVAGCPVICRLKKIMGDDWRTHIFTTNRTRTNYHTGEAHSIAYNYEDIWHLAYSSDDYEALAEFARETIGFDQKQADELTRLWSVIREGYASLSLKAIRNILPFLREGMIYSKAVALAKIPDILGRDCWEEHRDAIMARLDTIATENDYDRCVLSITNSLISNYKSRTIDNQQAHRNTAYKLDSSDKKDVKNCIIDTLSTRRWNNMTHSEQNNLQHDVEDLYQQFFSSTKREYYTIPRQSDKLKESLIKQFPEIPSKKWDKLYHHSMIDLFPSQKCQNKNTGDIVMNIKQLGTPDIGSIKKPVALRALHVLRKSINQLLLSGMIDDKTRIVVESARDLNDANWRKAIERYQKERDRENSAITEIIKEFRPNYSAEDIEKGRLLFEQIETGTINKEGNNSLTSSSHMGKVKATKFATDMQKYKLWKEQKFRCLYTGKYISLTSLFDDNKVDIEHTIPRSISFDNSLSNRTLCDSHFNRYSKSNRIPTELSNYADIKERIKPWEENVSHIKSQIELWKGYAKTAPTVERKNECIQQRHMWELELNYWQAKLRTFTVMKDDLDLGFRNSQLVDTRIITKYAFHYLKSVFNRVDVQKGSVTADFRKILGIQSVDEKKDREKHSHHAVDAAVLTMIPVAAKRDRMIELFYKSQEAPDSEKGSYLHQLKEEIKTCNVGNISKLVDTIEKNILVNHISKDQTLSQAKKPRYSGKKRIKDQWLQGDSIRGSLHKETFYGAIQNNNTVRLVVRKEPRSLGIKNNKRIKDYDEQRINLIVDKKIRVDIAYQVKYYMQEENLTFADALEKDFYCLDKNMKAIKLDKNGRPISHIRHVRCFATSGQGELQYDTALCIKTQTYPSRCKYKNNYYVQNDDNYLCLYYNNEEKEHKAFRLISYYDVAQLHIRNVNALFLEPEFATLKKGNRKHGATEDIRLKAIIKKGTRILLYSNYPEEVRDYDKEKLSNNLYVVYKFNYINKPYIYIYLKHHLEAREEKKTHKEENSYLRFTANKFKALIEHVDFEVDPLGNITFK